MSMEYRIFKLNQSITGWVNDFGLAGMKAIAAKLDGWIRRRIRMCHWKQWKKISTKHRNLVKVKYRQLQGMAVCEHEEKLLAYSQ